MVILTITLDELAIAEIALPDTLNCNTNSIILDGSGSSTGSTITYEWTGPNNYTSNQQNPEVFEPGSYNLIVSGAELCSAETTTVVIEEIVYPDISTEVSGEIDCNNLVVTLTGSSTTSNVTYQWTGPGVNANTPIANTTQSGTYTLVVTSLAGCTISEEIIVNEDLEPPDIFAEVLGRVYNCIMLIYLKEML